MKIEVQDSGPCRKILSVEAPAERVRQEYDHVLSDYCRSAKIDGFRPGRAPRNMVAKRFAGAVKDDARERLIHLAYRDALAESKLRPLEIVDVTPSALESPDAEWKIAFTVDVAPEFDLPAYKGLPIQRNPVEVTDEDIDRAITEIREGNARFEDVADRPAEAGDMVQVDFTGTVDGRPLEEVVPEAKGLGAANDFWVHLGEHALLPGFVEPLTGASIGDARTIETVFPEEFSVPGLRGRTARYETTVKAIRHRILPEIDTDFLSRWGAATVEQLRSQIRESLQRNREMQESRRLRNEIMETLLRNITMDLPENEVRRVTQNIVHEIVSNLIRQGQREERVKEQKEQVFEAAQARARDTVRARFLVEKIAGIEKIEVKDAEVDDQLSLMASMNGGGEEYVKRMKEGGGTDDVRRAILQRKVLDFLLENAKVEA